METKAMPTTNTTEFVLKIKNFLITQYTPATDIDGSTFFMTTTEIYNAIQRLYPSDTYTPANVTEWLDAAGFKFMDMGTLQLEWMLQKV